jgi:2'-5' RNA ligase
MRLFIAAEIGDTLAARAAEVSGELRRRAEKATQRAKVTWIPADRLHLTIRFIGEVDGTKASAITDRLARPPVDIRPFDLTLCGAGAFPRSGSPRVLWIGVCGGREELLAIERDIAARLMPLGVASEARAYSPHLTLARVREPAGLRTAALLDGLTDRVVGTVHIGAITLFQSTLSPKGPTYTPLLRVALYEGVSKDAPLH